MQQQREPYGLAAQTTGADEAMAQHFFEMDGVETEDGFDGCTDEFYES